MLKIIRNTIILIFYLTIITKSTWGYFTNLTQATQQINAIAISFDNKFIATGSADFRLRIYINNRSHILLNQTLNDAGSSAVQKLAFTQDGITLASGANDGKVYIYVYNGTLFVRAYSMNDCPGRVSDMSFSYNGLFLFVLCSNTTTFIYRYNGTQYISNDIIGYGSVTSKMAISQDGLLFIRSTYINYQTYLYNGTNFVFNGTIPTSNFDDIALSRDKSFLVGAHYGVVDVKQYNGTVFNSLQNFNPLTTAHNTVQISADNQYILSAGTNSVFIGLWNGTKFGQGGYQILTQDPTSIYASVFSQDSSYILIGGYNRSVRVYYKCFVHCTTCTYPNYCSLCDNGYSLSSQNYCFQCTITNCSSCNATNICDTCNVNLTLHNNSCIYCQVANCLFCNATDICDTCITNFSVNINFACTSCIISNCAYCDPVDFCLICQANFSIFFNTTDNICIPCSIDFCYSCNIINVCYICNVNYTLLGNNTCVACNIEFCNACNDTDVCSISISGYSLLANNTCVECSITDCFICNDTNSCEICNGLLTVSSNLTCLMCSIQNCSFCNDTEVCQVCNIDYTLLTNNTCISCLITNCIYCDAVDICRFCQKGYEIDLINNTCNQISCNVTDCLYCVAIDVCGQCVPLSNLCQSCTQLGCLKCINLTHCQVCDAIGQYFMSANQTCSICELKGCLKCLSLDQCEICDRYNQYYLNQYHQCQLCSQTGCIKCTSLSECSACDTANQYFLNTSNNQCSICNQKGCSDCSSLTQCVKCDEAQQFYLNQFNKCEKCSLQGCLNCQSFMQCDLCNEGMQFYKNQSNICEKCSITGCNRCKSLGECQQCDQDNGYFLDKILKHCSNQKEAQNLNRAVLAFGLMAFIFMFVAKSSLPTLQLISGLQTCFFSLTTVPILNIISQTLIKIKPIVGFNSQNFSSQAMSHNEITNQNIITMGYQTSFFHNHNIMFVIQCVFLLVQGVLYLLQYKYDWIKSVYKFLQKQTMLLIFFNAMNVIFSVSLMTTAYPFQIVIILFSLTFLVLQIIHLLIYYEQYFGFNETFLFKQSYIKVFFISLLGCRLFIVFLCGVISSAFQGKNVFILIFQLIYCVLFTILQPYIRRFDFICVLVGQYSLLVFLFLNELINSLINSQLKRIPVGLSYFQLIFPLIIALSALTVGILTIYFDYIKPSFVNKIENEHTEQDINMDGQQNFKRDQFLSIKNQVSFEEKQIR